ncbi:hypothetical protein [Streptomyces sp. NPDC052721]|uniref:hypothetical protein n=1 Tax=Streptomyces sp. NPDC052721 TaxID=3154955 RepID=UPI00343D343A
MPASKGVWIPVREVWPHAADLDADTTFDDVPHELCAAPVNDVAAALRIRRLLPHRTFTAPGTSGRRHGGGLGAGRTGAERPHLGPAVPGRYGDDADGGVAGREVAAQLLDPEREVLAL